MSSGVKKEFRDLNRVRKKVEVTSTKETRIRATVLGKFCGRGDFFGIKLLSTTMLKAEKKERVSEADARVRSGKEKVSIMGRAVQKAANTLIGKTRERTKKPPAGRRRKTSRKGRVEPSISALARSKRIFP